MNSVGGNCKPDRVAQAGRGGALDFDLVSSALHENLIVNALKNNGGYFSRQRALSRRHDLYVLGADDDIYRLVFFKAAVLAYERFAAEAHEIIFGHGSREDIAFADKVGDQKYFSARYRSFRAYRSAEYSRPP